MIENKERSQPEAGFALYTLFTFSVSCILSYRLVRNVLQLPHSPEIFDVTKTGVDLLLIAAAGAATMAIYKSGTASLDTN
jgi:hypothetical protein